MPSFSEVVRDWIFSGITTEVSRMSVALDNLTREVKEMRTVNESAVTLIQGLAEQIRQNADNETAMQQLADDLDASAGNLGQAVQANTPQQPGQPQNPTA